MSINGLVQSSTKSLLGESVWTWFGTPRGAWCELVLLIAQMGEGIRTLGSDKGVTSV